MQTVGVLSYRIEPKTGAITATTDLGKQSADSKWAVDYKLDVLPRLRDAGRFEAWLWRIAINACRSSLRGRRRASVHEIAVDDTAAGSEPAQRGSAFTDDVTVKDAIRRAFRRLDSDKRSILVLHYVEERPVIEIARLLGIAEGTAKSRLHAARKSLERALEVER